MRKRGLEPLHPLGRYHLKVVRLPISPLPQMNWGANIGVFILNTNFLYKLFCEIIVGAYPCGCPYMRKQNDRILFKPIQTGQPQGYATTNILTVNMRRYLNKKHKKAFLIS